MRPRERKERLVDIPPDRVNQIVTDFADEGAKVTKSVQPDGRWCVEATFDEPPDDSINAAPPFKRNK